MAVLRSRGVALEEYDLPVLKTVKGVVANMEGNQLAWFKDSTSNLLALTQLLTSSEEDTSSSCEMSLPHHPNHSQVVASAARCQRSMGDTMLMVRPLEYSFPMTLHY
jgi:hypothetical protein